MIVTGTCDTNNSIFGLWCLTPLSAIFQLYRGSQYYWWKQPEIINLYYKFLRIINIEFNLGKFDVSQ
jgi:hypothetical protein